jgi:hypothetical protein
VFPVQPDSLDRGHTLLTIRRPYETDLQRQRRGASLLLINALGGRNVSNLPGVPGRLRRGRESRCGFVHGRLPGPVGCRGAQWCDYPASVANKAKLSSVRGLRITGYCGARCENHANGWTHRLGRKYAISRGQVGRGRFQRRSGDGGRAVRGEGLCAGAGRHSDQPGAARRAECAGSASGLCGLGRFDAQAAAKSRRTFGRRSAEDRGRNSATGEPR